MSKQVWCLKMRHEGEDEVYVSLYATRLDAYVALVLELQEIWGGCEEEAAEQAETQRLINRLLSGENEDEGSSDWNDWCELVHPYIYYWDVEELDLPEGF